MQIIENGLSFKGLRPRKSTRLVVLHHSASPDVPAAEIHAWHLARGWAGIGYHFVIRKDGSIERGRPLDAIGAHAGAGVNGCSIGICLCGNFMNEVPTRQQIISLLELLAWLNAAYISSAAAGLDIKLHREVATTECPGILFPVEQIRKSRQSAAANGGGKLVEEWKNNLLQEARAADLIHEEHDPDEPAAKWFVLAVALQVLEYIKKGGKELEG